MKPNASPTLPAAQLRELPPAEQLLESVARWLRRTNKTLAACTGVPVTHRLALRALLGGTLLALALLQPQFTGWTALCLLQGGRWALEAAREYIDLGGCDAERDTINPYYKPLNQKKGNQL